MTRITVSDYARRYLKDRVQSHMTSKVTINRIQRGALNESTGLYTADSGTLIYSGEARIWTVNTGTVFDTGAGEMALASTYCSIPQDSVVPNKDDQVVVLYCPGDLDLDGRVFRVVYVDGGGLMTPTRRMQIIAQVENRNFDPGAP